jgi:hypothetical protein
LYVSLSRLRIPDERARELVGAFRRRRISSRKPTGSSIYRCGSRTRIRVSTSTHTRSSQSDRAAERLPPPVSAQLHDGLTLELRVLAQEICARYRAEVPDEEERYVYRNDAPDKS